MPPIHYEWFAHHRLPIAGGLDPAEAEDLLHSFAWLPTGLRL
jgi:hypothetical protein